MRAFTVALASLLLVGTAARAEEAQTLMFRSDAGNLPSVQRGARNFMNYCSGCHSMKYLRYSRIGEDLGIPDDLLKKNLMFTTEKRGETIVSALPATAKEWFGQLPPDLSLETKARGADWVYTYLLSFYVDPNRPMGVNNTMLPGVSMPHVLGNLQGWQQLVTKTEEVKNEDGSVGKKEVFERFEVVQAGSLNEDQYKAFVTDLTNFMVYAAEPSASKRVATGVRVMIYLLVLLGLTYLLKKEFWRDIH